MNKADRVDRWVESLRENLTTARALVDRGRVAYDADPAISLAFEALSNRVGDLAKKLSAADPTRFSDPAWSAAARNRDEIVHHYERVDLDVLWHTVSVDFLTLKVPLPSRNLGAAKVDISDNAAVREILHAEDDEQYRSR